MGLFDGTPLERPITCERCGRPRAECTCPRGADGAVVLPADQLARVRRERRRGKFVTVVAGLDPAASDAKGMLKRFKSALGVGGSLTGDGFELQGDHRDRLVEDLRALGYPAKPSGG